MKTNCTSNYNPQSFKGVNVIKVNKKAFTNCKDINECKTKFSQEIKKISGEKGGMLNTIKKLFSYDNHKICIYSLDSCYNALEHLLKSFKMTYSPEWFALRTKLPIQAPETNDFLSFCVLTGEHKDQGIKLTKKIIGRKKDFQKEGKIIFPPSNTYEFGNLRLVHFVTKMNVEIEKGVKEIMTNSPVNTIEIDSLEEIQKLAEKIV